MIVTKRTLPRRTFLRGAGAAIALPLLDAMVPALAATPSPTKRLGFIYLPNGVAMNFSGVNYWTPKGTGKSFELSPILRPLAAHRDRLTVISGLAHHAADAHDDGANGDHTRATARGSRACTASAPKAPTSRTASRPIRSRQRCSGATRCCRRWSCRST